MFGFSKNHICPIGVDMGDDCLRMAQLGRNGKTVSLIASGDKNRPFDVKPGSIDWQQWAIDAICEIKEKAKFHGRDVIATIPASEVYIDYIKMPKVDEEKCEDTIFSRIKQKLPFGREDAAIKYIPTDDDMAVILTSQRQLIDRHLAIYEKADLKIKAIGVWPIAMINSYVNFFGRRKSDLETTVCLVSIEANRTNIVICRHTKLFFARSVSIGASQLQGGKCDKNTNKLTSELTACGRLFGSMYNTELSRLIFLSDSLADGLDTNICTVIAKQLQIPAQIGDCLAAVDICFGDNGYMIDRRQCQLGWATAFGLSLS